MTKDDYIKKSVELGKNWAPGWDAITDCFKELYPDDEPYHIATNLSDRAISGGGSYIDGYSIYSSYSGYKHIVTYGLSELYSNVDAFGGDYSGLGYEMTIKIRADSYEDCSWALDILNVIARYTITNNTYFEPYERISNEGNPVKQEYDSKITGFVFVEDTELTEIDTVHGKVNFLQLVGVTQRELDILKIDPSKAVYLISNMIIRNSMLVTELDREKSYL